MLESQGVAKTGERDSGASRWWGAFSIESGDTLRWRIGPMRMWIARTEQEWRVIHEQGQDPFEPALAVAQPSGNADEPTPLAHRVRFAFRSTPDPIRVLPALPDRALVVKPEVPIHLPPGEEIPLFISVPLWIGIHVGASSTPLYETPIFRPSDTWFGPPTEAGGRCYASRTRARVSLENLALLPQRAASKVRIRNHAESELVLERLRLPSPTLSLFASANGQLWTETVTLERKEDGQSASVDLERGPSREIGRAELIMGPREPLERGLLTRAFGGLF